MIVASNKTTSEALPQIIGALGRLRDYQAHDPLMNYLLNQDREDVRTSSAIAMLSLGAAHIIDVCLQHVAEENWPLIPLALGANRQATSVLIRRAEENPHPDGFLALGLLGDISAVNTLWNGLTSEEYAAECASALYLITAAELFEASEAAERPDALPPAQGETTESAAKDAAAELGESAASPPRAAAAEPAKIPHRIPGISQDPFAWQSWWHRHRERFRREKRYRLGKLATPDVLVAMLWSESTPRWLPPSVVRGTHHPLQPRLPL